MVSESDITAILRGQIPASPALDELRRAADECPACAALQLACAKLTAHLDEEAYNEKMSAWTLYAPSPERFWRLITEKNVPETEEPEAAEEKPAAAPPKPVVPDFSEFGELLGQTRDENRAAPAEPSAEPQGATESCSETLAKIYIKQMKYDRAVKIFERLMVKNPEKSIYFADQIRFLNLIIENNKK